MAKASKGEKALEKRVSALEREEREERRTVPIDPAQAQSMAAAQAREVRPGEGRGDFLRIKPGNANFSDPVASDIARLKGRTRNDLVGDRERGASSPLTRRR